MLLLDTFNILHTTGVLPPELAGLDVPGLASLIQNSRHASEKVVFVCDGLPASDLPEAGPLSLEGFPDAEIDVRYSGRTATADDDIRTMINASSSPRRLVVVSSDHAVIRHARKRRCIALTSNEFLQQLVDDSNIPRSASPLPKRPSMMSEEQVRKWIDVFKVDEHALPELAPPDASTSESLIVRNEAPATIDEAATPNEPDRQAEAGLPPDLIGEAEALWEREVGKPTPPTSRPIGGTPRAEPAAAPSPPPEVDDPLNMNSILPNDGLTRPLRKRDDRHRPA